MNPERRVFLASLGAVLTVRPTSTHAQQAGTLRTIGVLMGLANDAETQARAKAIERGLASKGWVVGQNLRIEYRFAASDAERISSFSRELVALHPDIIIGHSTPVVAALLQATQTIPIVFAAVGDPVGSGFVASLAQPGGNITGFVTLQSTIIGKHLSILRELKSQLSRVALMFNSESAPRDGTFYIPRFMKSPTEFHVTPIAAEVHSPADIETIMAELGAAPGSGLIVMAGNFTSLHRALIISLAARLRIPTIYPYRYFVDEGGLVSYGVDVLDLFRRVPDYVDRILQGARPSDLPIQAPKKFELVINLKTARTLGLVVPRILLAGADALIE
jgi:putative tryptophan/tyrosine transport system substrate-binding protein